MLDLPPLGFHALVAIVGLLLYIIVWRIMMPLPATARLVARLLASVIVVLPLLLLVQALLTGTADRQVATTSPPPPRPAAERIGSAPPERQAPRPPGDLPAVPEATAPAPEDKLDEIKRLEARRDEIRGLEAAGRATAPRAPSPSSVSRPRAPEPQVERVERDVDGRGPPAGSDQIVQTSSDPWDVVPVFYGTDRARLEHKDRAAYGAGRAKRLELGQALVTVPKSHQVPQVERPWAYKLPFTQIVLFSQKEDPAKHFTLKDVRSLSKEDFLALVRQRLARSKSYPGHALVFVHGFSVSFDNALYRTAQIAYDLKFDSVPFLYSWPSQGVVGAQDYSSDRESTGQAEPYLREFLTLVSAETGARTVSIIAHSMGNQLLLRVLRDMRLTAPDSVKVSEIILAAPDVDRDTFEFLAREIKGLPRGMTLLAASNDRALAISRQFWGGTPRAGDVPLDIGPVVIDGVDTIDVTAMNTALFSLNHAAYAEKPELLRDIEQLIRRGTRPPKARVPTLVERSTISGGSYWSYPGVP